MLVNYVAREGVELTVHKESVAVEEIKEVALRSRRTEFIYYSGALAREARLRSTMGK